MQGNPEMESVPGSTNVTKVGYDAAEKTLYVRFRSGAEYRYHEVPQRVYDELKSAASAGKYLHQQIVGIYPYSK